jgi:hypothetical protein
VFVSEAQQRLIGHARRVYVEHDISTDDCKLSVGFRTFVFKSPEKIEKYSFGKARFKKEAAKKNSIAVERIGLGILKRDWEMR